MLRAAGMQLIRLRQSFLGTHSLRPWVKRTTASYANSLKNWLSGSLPEGSLEQKIGAYYRLYMDSVRRNREDYEPIRPLLNEIESIRTRQDAQHAQARLHALNIQYFLSSGLC